MALLTLLDELPDGGVGQLAVWTSNSFEVHACASLGDLWSMARRMPGSVAVVDWQRIGGLLSEEHRHDLSLFDRLVPIILVVDGGVARHMSADDLGVTAVLDRASGAAELLALATQARSRRLQLVGPNP